MTKLRIDVWSDIACPWCYVGKRRLDAALKRFPHEIDLVWHSFELDPRAPRVHDSSHTQVERLARKYRLSISQAQQMIDRMVRTGAEEGIQFRFDRIRSGNTFDAHRLLHLAKQHGVQHALKERLLRAYFCEGQVISDVEVLVPLAVETGLEELDVRDVLGSDRFGDAAREDERIADELGVTGVPFFVFAGRLGVAGAQPADVLLGALERAWSEVASEVASGPACGPEGC